MLARLFAGLAGVLDALQSQFAAPSFVFFVVSGETVIYNVIGGIGTLVGPLAGAGFFLLLREGFSRLFTLKYLDPMGLGGLAGMTYLVPVGPTFIAMTIFLPPGLPPSSPPRPTPPPPPPP